MTKAKTLMGAGALVALSAIGILGSVAYASGPRQAQAPGATPSTTTPHVVRLAGKVQSGSSTGLVLQASQTRTVNVSAGPNTWILVQKNNTCSQGQLSDLQTGKAATVAGTSTSTNAVDARVIAQGNCARELTTARGRQAVAKVALARHAAEGTVKSISCSTIILTNAKGNQVNVNTNAGTVFHDNGFQSVSALKVGDKVQVFGQATKPQAASGTTPAPQAQRTITAWAIHDLSANTQVRPVHVASVNGNTLTLGNGKNNSGATLTLTSSTGYKTATVTNGTVSFAAATQADVKAGSNLLVEGNFAKGAKSGTATAVIILPAGKIK